MSSKYRYRAAVVIGRWQLAHLGHLALQQEALALAPKVYIVVGSSFRAREPRNPFTTQERIDQLSSMLAPEELARVEFVPVRDYYDHDRWNRAVRKAIGARLDTPSSVVIVGHKKDSSAYYLDHFPEWTLHQVTSMNGLNATDLREVLFGTEDTEAALSVLSSYVHPRVKAWLTAWAQLPHIEARRNEHAAVKAYRKKYPGPYYLTADAVVEVADHILLIRRGKEFGHGLWALPGGFIEPGERMLSGALRELREETCLSLPSSTLRQSLQDKELFDDPARSPRGRLISHSFHFRLGGMALPEVRARDDAMAADWVHKSELSALEDQCFEDHFLQLDRFLGILPRD